MNLEITGKLIDKGETQQIKDTFRKREFVLELPDESGSQYINYAKMQLVQQKCELLDRFNEGDNLRVSFNIKGNRYERDGKTSYFSNLDAWRIEHADGGQQGGGGNQQQAQQQGGSYNNGGNQGGGNQGFNQNQGGNNTGWGNQGGGNQGGYANANQGGNSGGNSGSDDLPF